MNWWQEPEIWISLAALLIAGAAAWFTREQAKEARAANGSARAQVEYSRRATEAAEEQVRLAQATFQLDQAARDQQESIMRSVSPWTVEASTGNGFTLVNGSNLEAFDVEVVPPAQTSVPKPLRWQTISPLASAQFMVVFPEASRSRTVQVRWRWEPGGDERTVSVDLPATRSGRVWFF